jgi:hypothetical protein
MGGILKKEAIFNLVCENLEEKTPIDFLLLIKYKKLKHSQTGSKTPKQDSSIISSATQRHTRSTAKEVALSQERLGPLFRLKSKCS